MSQSQKLQVDAAHGSDHRVVVRARLFAVRLGTVRQMGLFFTDVHMGEQVIVHEIVITLVIVSGQSLIFVQIHGGHL